MESELGSGSLPSQDECYVPPGSNDPGWKYAYLKNRLDTNCVTCRLCGKAVKGGISRMKQHLAHIKGNVAACPKSDPEIRKTIKDYMEKSLKKKEDAIVALKEMKAEVVIKSSEGSADPHGEKRQRTSEDVCSSKQSTIKDAFKKEERTQVNRYVGKFFYENNIPFNVVTSNSFIRMCEAIGQYGSGYRTPTYHEISESILRDEVKDTNDYLETHRAIWKESGCSIMTDAWTDMRGRSIMNFCVNCEKGTAFLKSVDASGESHTAEYIFSLVEKCLQDVGPDNVLQVVTDNASPNVAAGRMLKTKYPRIHWTSCAAHCIDLMLEEIGKEKKVKTAILRAKTMTTFIYSHSKTLNMMRQFTEKREIVRPGQTRFATTFLTLQSVMEKKDKLRLMFSSDEWRACKWAKTKIGEKVGSIVFAPTFWQQVALTLKIFSPLVYLLRIVDGEQKPSLGFVYGGLLDAKKEVMSVMKDDPSQYKVFIDAIESKSKGRLDSPLYVAAYYLNPYYFYRDISLNDNADTDTIYSSFLECLDTFYPDVEIQDRVTQAEMENYRKAEGSFGRPIAVRQRSVSNIHDDSYNPATWWRLHGTSAPYLKAMALKILKLTSSSSGCERNWSVFEAVHTKKRNKLELKRMNDLVFVKFNSKLKSRQGKKDPLATKDRSNVNEWIGIDEEEEVFQGTGLTWDLVGEASGATELVKDRRSQRLATPLPLLDEEDEVPLVEEDIDDDDDDLLELGHDSDSA